MSAHTPGPWKDGGARRTEGRERRSVEIVADQGWLRRIAIVEREHDAPLIAAAPEMLDALKWVLPLPADCERCKRTEGPCVGHAAIAKAEGRHE